MAGIGFELRKLLKRESLLGILRAYGYAGLISSGPWVLSILGIMLVGILSVGKVSPTIRVQQFLVVVNYIMAGSLDPHRPAAAHVHPLRGRPAVPAQAQRGGPQPHGRPHHHLHRQRRPQRGGGGLPVRRGPGAAGADGGQLRRRLRRLDAGGPDVGAEELPARAGDLRGRLRRLHRRLAGPAPLQHRGAAGRLPARPGGAAVPHAGGHRARPPPQPHPGVVRLPPAQAVVLQPDVHRVFLQPGDLGRQADVLVQPRHLRAGHRPAARLGDLRPADLPGLPVDHPRHGGLPRAHRDRLRRALRSLLQRRPRGGHAAPHRAPAAGDDLLHPPGHLRDLQGAGSHPAGAAAGRRPHPQRHRHLVALPAALLRRPGGGRRAGAAAVDPQRAVLPGPARVRPGPQLPLHRPQRRPHPGSPSGWGRPFTATASPARPSWPASSASSSCPACWPSSNTRPSCCRSRAGARIPWPRER